MLEFLNGIRLLINYLKQNMKNAIYFLSLILILGMMSCGSGDAGSAAAKGKDMVKDAASKVASTSQPSATSQPTSQPSKAMNFPPLFKKILDAHGGLDTWNAMNTLKFTKGEGPEADMHVVDLKSRRSTNSVPGKYTLGNNGDKVWVSPNKEAFPGKSPRFMNNLFFYFVALPFVLADPGVVYEDLGEKTVNGKKYAVLKTSFKAGVGDAPGDQYVLYADPKTHVIDFINYSVTYFDASRAETYSALQFVWEDVNGLKFPSVAKSVEWNDEQLGEVKRETKYNNFSYSKDRMDLSAFDVPAGAYTE